MNDSPLNAALRHFEATEANLVKIEKVLVEIEAAIPQGIAFGDNPEYENNYRSFNTLLRLADEECSLESTPCAEASTTEEPDAGKPHVRGCTGGAGQPASLP